MNMDSKMLNKTPANRIQIYTMTKLSFYPFNREFNIYKSKYVTNNKNGRKGKKST